MKPPARLTPGLIAVILLILVLLNASAIAWLGWPAIQSSRAGLSANVDLPGASQTPTRLGEATPGDSAVPALSPTGTFVSLHVEDPQAGTILQREGVLLLALRDGAYVHLFAYHPAYLPLTRLTNDAWDEIQPALSPNGTLLAYSSNQDGHWDLYVRDLASGETRRITDTPAFDGSPSWSPDGQWLAYETYQNDNLDIYLKSVVDPNLDPVPLTDEPSSDTSPNWSPGGRQIAFVSDRSGESEIWIADLDQTSQRFSNVSQLPQAADDHPFWSPDGHILAWASQQDGEHLLLRWDSQNPTQKPIQSGLGDWPAWSPSGDLLFTAIAEPNRTTLGAYQVADAIQRVPTFDLPGALYGMEWKSGPLSGWLLDAIQQADQAPANTLVQPVLTLQPGEPAGRLSMVPIQDVSAPEALINDAVDEAFNALRGEAATLSGWDVLSSLENAYVPLTTPPDPTIQEDWLYTGRAFSINPLILSAGWMAVVREDFNGRTYWRLYLKARYQDGSAGMPLDQPIWDLNARYAGDPAAYDQGGAIGPVPAGYWIDLTELASRYGWERLPARANWRTYFPGVRFNQFVIRDGLDWNQAMAQLYPPEALATVTSIPTYTNTPTNTPVPTRTRIPTRTPTATRTPLPSLTPTVSPQASLPAAGNATAETPQP